METKQQPKPNDPLKACKANGTAVRWTDNLFKCGTKDYCPQQRDFGGQKCCIDSEPLMQIKKEAKQP